MSVFLDASVIVAILAQEADAAAQVSRLGDAEGPVLVSALVTFEASIGLARNKAGPGVRLTPAGIDAARAVVADFLSAVDAQDVTLTPADGFEATIVISRFGKHVGHPAGLNMGDAFAYVCAQGSGAALLYKGADFSKTDVKTA